MADYNGEHPSSHKVNSLGSGQRISVAEEETASIRMLNARKTLLRNFTSRATTTALIPDDDSSMERRRLNKLSHINSKEKQSKFGSKKSGLISKSADLQDDFVTNLDIKSSSQSLSSSVKHINEKLPNIEHDLRYTKLFLQKQGLHNVSIWSHLTDVLNKIISEQPENVIDYFEEYSRKVKQEKMTIYDSLRDIFIPPVQLETAKNQLQLVNNYGIKISNDELEAVGEEEEVKEPERKMDLEEAAFYLRHAGVAIPQTQLFTINIAMKKLKEDKNLLKTRFWGKVKCTDSDYFVIECELPDEEYEKRIFEEDAVAEIHNKENNFQEGDRKEETFPDEDELLEYKAETADEKESMLVDKVINQDEIKNQKESLEEGFESKPHGVEFDFPEGEENITEEDPLLPPLPPPKKLLTYKVPEILKPVVKEEIKVPAEKIGEGLNKKIYFVTSTPELDWVELPKVTPDEIVFSRQIKVAFTGNLERKMFTYPQFPGTEKNYLRAQIARISAATQISPIGFYKLGGGGGGEEEEEEEEEPEEDEEGGADKSNLNENPKFQPVSIKDLTEPSLASWVHHSPHILKQGRTVWWSSKKAEPNEEEAEEEQEEEEEEEGEEAKETGPLLLTPLSEDTDIEGTPAWSARQSHQYNAEMAAAVLHSNRWPGSYTFAVGRKWENIYCGSGHKHLPQGFSPTPLLHPEYEYELGPEIMEIQDPTVEVEEAWRQAHKKKPPPAESEEGEGDEGEEEEEEEDDDD